MTAGSEAYAGGDWLQPPHTEACGWCKTPPLPCDCGLESMVGEIHRLQAVVKRLERWRDSEEQKAQRKMILDVIRAKREAGAPRDAAFFTAVWPAALAALKRERAVSAAAGPVERHMLMSGDGLLVSAVLSADHDAEVARLTALHAKQLSETVERLADDHCAAFNRLTARLAEAERFLADVRTAMLESGQDPRWSLWPRLIGGLLSRAAVDAVTPAEPRK